MERVDQLPSPLVSVIVPVFNYGSVVCRTIESVKRQTLNNLECIIVDDGSTDNSAEVIKECIKDDKRFQYVHKENGGVSTTRNLGARMAKGIYLCFLDADDAIEPKFLEVCVPVLESDRSIGVAYTGLRVVTANGRTGIGKWPGEFDYDSHISGHNGCPTCSVIRKVCWDRIGGQRQRYGPLGMGSEDAEGYLRMGAIGYNIVRVTSEPLFVYSMGTGGTSHPDYEEVNWLEWHPEVYDAQHPFASVARPVDLSHPVRAYDEPLVSVIIPVGPKHVDLLIDAIDSVESQSFRKWEIIVVDDTGLATDCENCDTNWLDELLVSYPYLRVFKTPGKLGAGYARNRGVELSRAPYILYLDADDFLKPTAIEQMLIAHAEYGGAIYTDYEAHATGVTDVRKMKNAVKYHDPNDGYTVLAKKAMEYDWRRIQTKIENPPYIWNLITTLFPKTWHYEIGGFDEAMPSWEDYDYWVRMAYAGKSFTRLPVELVVYLYHTGSRREEGHELGGQLIYYLNQKREGVTMAPCPGCGKKAVTQFVSPRSNPRAVATTRSPVTADDNQFVLVKYATRNLSQHHCYGTAQFEYPMQVQPGMFLRMERHPLGGYRFYYGYHGGGESFMVHRNDAELESKYEPIEPVRRERHVEIEPPVEEREPTPAPTRMTMEDVLGGGTLTSKQTEPTPEPSDPLDEPDEHAPLDEKPIISYSNNSDDLQRLPGIGNSLASALREDGYATIEELISLGVDGLQDYKGVGAVKAERIIGAARSLMSE